MTIKTEVVDGIEKDGYPKIKKGYGGNIVLFTSFNSGVCLFAATSSSNKVGEKSDYWEESNFELFTGSVTLSNQ